MVAVEPAMEAEQVATVVAVKARGCRNHRSQGKRARMMPVLAVAGPVVAVVAVEPVEAEVPAMPMVAVEPAMVPVVVQGCCKNIGAGDTGPGWRRVVATIVAGEQGRDGGGCRNSS
jgi:hypothetical protein